MTRDRKANREAGIAYIMYILKHICIFSETWPWSMSHTWKLFSENINGAEVTVHIYAAVPFIDPRPSTNQSTSLKSVSLFLLMVSVRPSKTKQTDQRVKPLFKLVLRLVLGRGSLYDSSLVCYFFYVRSSFSGHSCNLNLNKRGL